MIASIAIIALGLAALSRRTELWESVTATVMLFGLLAGIVGLALARGSARVFWIGFSVFGWGYFVFVSGPWSHENFRARLWTNDLAGKLYTKATTVPPGIVIGHGVAGVYANTRPIPTDINRISQELGVFVQICHELMTLAIATLAGLACLLVERRSREATERPPISTARP